MPLARLELRNEFGLGDPELYRGAAVGKEDTKAILDGVAVAGLVGILRQLGEVAELAAEVFQDLHEQVMITSARGNKMLSRIRDIEETLPSIEDAIGGKGSYIDLAYQTGSDWRSEMKITDTHLSYSDFPRFMMNSYEECRDPPRLYLLDKYDRGGIGACLKRYSDPSYFKKAWATSEPEKDQKIQKEKNFQKIKRKYSQVKNGEIQSPISTSQFNSSSARFAPLRNDDQSFSAENSSASDTRLKPVVVSGPQLLKTVNKLNCIEQVSQANPSVMPDELEHDRLSVSNVQNNQDHQDASQFHSNEHVFGVDDNSQFDLVHRNSTSQLPSVICDEKSELMKTAGLNLSDGKLQDSKLLVEDSSRNGSLDHAKLSPIIPDSPKLSFVKKQFEEVTEVESYVDALNTLEAEAETDFECQTKGFQPSSSNRHQETESGVEKLRKRYTSSSDVVPLAANSSNTSMLQSEICLDGLRTLDRRQSTQEASMSATNGLRKIVDDQHPWSNDAKLGAILSSGTTPPMYPSSIPSIKLWTNGNLLGLQPSKPPDIWPPISTGKRTESNSLNTSMNVDKENKAHGQRSPQLNSIGNIEGSSESLSLRDQKSLNNNQFLNRKYVAEGHNSMEQPTRLNCQYDDFCVKQNSQEQSEAISFSQHEGSQGASPNVLTTRISQIHQSTSAACSMEVEQYSTTNVSSPLMDSLHTRKCLSPSFPGLTRRNDMKGLQIKPSVSHTRSSFGYEPKVNDCRSEGKPLIDIRQKSLNGVASQTVYDQKLASQTLDEQSFINKATYGVLEKSISSSFRHSQKSSPPLEHMKISFHPMNSQGESNLKVAHDGCISREKDEHVFSSFQLFPGCTLPAQDGGSESDADTFGRSYPYSSEDLPSPLSDSTSDIWEQDECSISKINEVSDDLRRTSSSSASISSKGGFEQINHVGQEIGLKDICVGNDAVPFQYGGYISSIPSLESLINHMSSSPKNAATLVPNELPPPPPLPPIQWRLLKRSYEISEDNYSNVSQIVNHFEGPLNQNLCGSAENENIIPGQPPLGEDGQCKKMQDSQKMDSRLQTNLSSNPFELDRSQHLLHQIRDMDIQHKLKPCEESKSQVATSKGVEEMEDLLHQIRTKTFNLRRTATSGPSATQQATNGKVAAMLEKANAIRQACASSDEADDSDEWSGA